MHAKSTKRRKMGDMMMRRGALISSVCLGLSALAVWNQLYTLTLFTGSLEDRSDSESNNVPGIGITVDAALMSTSLGLVGTSARTSTPQMMIRPKSSDVLVSMYGPPENDPSIYWTVSALTQVNPVVIVMDCMGELGNYLHFHAHGYGLYVMAKEYGINANVIFHRRERSTPKKAKATTQILNQCFPVFQEFELDETHDILRSRRVQEEWLGEERASKFVLRHSQHDVEPKALDMMFRRLQQAIIERESNPPTDPEHNELLLPLPFLQVSVMKNFAFLDEHYDIYRSLFQMNETKCCDQVPDPDETVFVSRFPWMMDHRVVPPFSFFHIIFLILLLLLLLYSTFATLKVKRGRWITIEDTKSSAQT
jgi:hypothetical protein